MTFYMMNFGGVRLRLSLLSAPQSELVVQVLALARPNTLQVGHVIGKLLDGPDLLLQVLLLQEVHHLGQRAEVKISD